MILYSRTGAGPPRPYAQHQGQVSRNYRAPLLGGGGRGYDNGNPNNYYNDEPYYGPPGPQNGFYRGPPNPNFRNNNAMGYGNQGFQEELGGGYSMNEGIV